MLEEKYINVNENREIEAYLEQLKKIYASMREDMKHQWNRVLPLGDLLIDRWEKANYLEFGEKTSIYDSSVVMGDVSVGKNTWIGPYTLLDGTGGRLAIGDHCSISSGVQIYTHDTVDFCVSGGIAKKNCGQVSIGNNCYIGPMVIISCGVHIGVGCIVGANSFVNQSCGDHVILAGTPAKEIGRVEIDAEGSVNRIYY